MLTLRDDGFAIHPLTQSVLRSILREEGKEAELCIRLHNAIQKRLSAAGYEIRGKFPAGLFSWLPHVFSVVSGAIRTSFKGLEEDDVMQVLDFMVRGMTYHNVLQMSKRKREGHRGPYVATSLYDFHASCFRTLKHHLALLDESAREQEINSMIASVLRRGEAKAES